MRYTTNNHLIYIKFTETEVLKETSQLSVKEPVPTIFLHSSLNIVLPIFATNIIFNYSLTEEKNRNNLGNNYRPASIISCLVKLFELLVYPSYIILSMTISHIVSMDLGFVAQSKFNLYHLFHTYLIRSFEAFNFYTDSSSAFDKVDHARLLMNIKAFGIDCSLLLLLKFYFLISL